MALINSFSLWDTDWWVLVGFSHSINTQYIHRDCNWQRWMWTNQRWIHITATAWQVCLLIPRRIRAAFTSMSASEDVAHPPESSSIIIRSGLIWKAVLMKSQFAACSVPSTPDYTLQSGRRSLPCSLQNRCACEMASLYRIRGFSDTWSYHLRALT